MKNKLNALRTAALAAAFASPGVALAVPVTVTDLGTIELGAMIVGPVGPTVDVSLAADDLSYGDLSSSVSCPAGFTECVPPNNPAGTLYIYQHTITFAEDAPNDAPFPAPSGTAELDGSVPLNFSLGFEAAGFTGIAGFDDRQVQAAYGDDAEFGVRMNDDGSLSWFLDPAEAGGVLEAGEVITFFWQTTQAPSGPGGQFSLGDGSVTASGNGPLPRPVEVTPTPVNEPALWMLALVGIAGVGAARARR